MDEQKQRPPDHLVINVEHREDPVARVTEVDAFAATRKYGKIVVRGPLFGYAEQRPGERPRWRLLGGMDTGYPQDARDDLNSYLWLKARDEAEDHLERRALLAGVARLETEPVDSLTAAGTRYRIVRADEFARIGEHQLEPPRPTDIDLDGWDDSQDGGRSPAHTEGVVIDHAAAVGLTEGLDRVGLLPVSYTSERFPPDVLADSRRALTTHPGVVLLPPVFRVMEHKELSWSMVGGGYHGTPQEARRALVHYLTEFLPMYHRIEEKDVAVYAKAAERFKQQRRANELRVRGRCFEIVRVERMMRIGPDGPEPPRRSDTDIQEPMKIRPTMDEWGTITTQSASEE
ncbi:DUF5954 family protein [Streptomyces sp. NBC_01387]|uniref:DUF5954 family protein n=1 Tax=unclassified Streptomyces TaxID=2593676 RepID=UPI00225AB9A6|nr:MULTISPECIES: DUF5954 family protein [unclassified Streptomyces]MCX4550697.1 DUF5954 family protein [Streptomyces sp. NBC_01500]WSC22135.1 DUF5954 family protein [Streptomyces sp. NBC_01766]WSV55983.1 DUF5954 family protein [Streptomyces sp. NBC_01014]